MNENLKIAITNEAEARAHMLVISEKMVEATRVRDTTAADLAALQSNFEAAAQKHAEAVAAVELGDAEVDTDITAAELAKARAALADEADLLQTLRTQTAIVEALEARYLASHASLNKVMADLKAAKVEHLRRKASATMREADRLLDDLTERSAEIVALSGALSELGAAWVGGNVVIDRAAAPDATAIHAHRAALLAELEAA